MMKTKEYTHPVVIKLMNHIIESIPVSQSGTYNRNDPTYYGKGSVEVDGYKGHIWKVEMNDCTWGIEITISLKLRHCNYATFAGFYISWGDKYSKDNVILRDCQCSKPLMILKGISKYLIPIQDDHEEWTDPAGGVHYGYEGDPAAMYE